MPNRSDIVACARQFHGVRFAHQGRSASGLDCLGLLLVTANAAGITLQPQPLDIPTYGTRPDTQLLKQRLDTLLVPIPASALEPADIVLFNITQLPQHLALITDYPVPAALGMIHAYAPARCVVEHRYDRVWQQACAGAYRLPHFC